MELTKYSHSKYDPFKVMNKLTFPATMFSWEQADEFNSIYFWAKENCIEGKKTPSGGIAGGPKNRYHSFYFYNSRKASVELIICHTSLGCYRFIITNKRGSDNTISGKEAIQTVYKEAEKFNVLDTFKNEAVEPDKGKEIKTQIESPMIEVVSQKYLGVHEHCHHLDLNSSYFSRICERWPELKPLGEYLYNNRKNNNGYYKHVLTNSIGIMQSEYCVDIKADLKSKAIKKAPYQLSEFAKEAINGTNKIIRYYYRELELNGFKPLLINTDGIWYKSADGTDRAYHDSNEGTALGQWKNDHKNVKLYIKSAGSYQYIEDGKCNTVLRGTCALDSVKPRDQWEFMEIRDYTTYGYKFDEKLGVYKNDI